MGVFSKSWLPSKPIWLSLSQRCACPNKWSFNWKHLVGLRKAFQRCRRIQQRDARSAGKINRPDGIALLVEYSRIQKTTEYSREAHKSKINRWKHSVGLCKVPSMQCTHLHTCTLAQGKYKPPPSKLMFSTKRHSVFLQLLKYFAPNNPTLSLLRHILTDEQKWLNAGCFFEKVSL